MEHRAKLEERTEQITKKYQEARKQNVEGRKKTEQRQKIRKTIRELSKLLAHGTKERNVKEGMKDFVSTAIAKSTLPDRKAKEEFEQKVGKWNFVFSKTGAAVFIMAYIAASLYSAEKEGLYLSLALNAICLGMYPGLVYMGGIRIIEKLRKEKKMSYLISIIIALAVFGRYVLLLLVILGVFTTFTYQNESEEKKV
jgi:hypothetical protein